ncbi:MAG TPA: amylo-alpha-1,6-glucosidase [Candidatus Limnocylindria bacterium]|nr:amylo-alpha-1,6-glucosidase [Candidatus Limnocylindria bacterium]
MTNGETGTAVDANLDDALAQRYAVLATSERDASPEGVLKHGHSFAVFDRHGDVRPSGPGEDGIYHRGTRHLSGLLLTLAGRRPLLLGSTANRDNTRLAIDLTNTDVGGGRGVEPRIPHSTIHLSRTKALWEGTCHERIVVRSFAARPVRIALALDFAADFADVFEVRGMQRPQRGRFMTPAVSERGVVLRYQGLDGVVRRTRIGFSMRPDALDGRHAEFRLTLPVGRAVSLEVTISCEQGSSRRRDLPALDEVIARTRRHQAAVRRGGARLAGSNELFNDWLARSQADLAMLTARTEQGYYPHAGVPWFSDPFGRDGLIVAMQSLWAAPHVARGVLRYLAANQAVAHDPESDAAPGKILHEVRQGEMAALGEVPFRCYYGSHDATPLFVALAAQYWRHTDDLATVAELWPNIERALSWMRTDGDADGDGFLEYDRQNADGLVQQGWKDSWDSIFHADGTLAAGPIALAEVQAYAYAALVGAAELARRLGHESHAEELDARAARLRAEFDRAFWDEELGTYAIALDGDKRRCQVRTSNPGHALYAGIALPERVTSVAAGLMSDASFSGWGIRTLAAGEARYNPISYHNGSIWPHDNALIARGMARYGLQDEAVRVLDAMFEASRYFELARLPELFCGFTRRDGQGPTRYPVACSPQAWASGAIYMLLEACLGMEIDAPARQVRFRHSRLPPFLDRLSISGLHIGEGRLDLDLERQRHGVGIRVSGKSGDVEVVAVK